MRFGRLEDPLTLFDRSFSDCRASFKVYLIISDITFELRDDEVVGSR